MRKRRRTKKRQPPMPRKGASPVEIKAWIAVCQAQSTPQELAEDLEAIFKTIGSDPTSAKFAPRVRLIVIENTPPDQ